MSKPKLEWNEQGEDEDAAKQYLSLLYPDAKAAAIVKGLRHSTPVEHAAKDLLRAAGLPLLPSDESHVAEDLKRIQKGKALGRGDDLRNGDSQEGANRIQR
jgi:hypothetical protein